MTASPVRLRSYLEGDTKSMYVLDRACFTKEFRFSRSEMKRFAEAPTARVVVADAGKKLVGFCIVHLMRGGVGYVVTLDVSPDVRRRGVARALMLRVEAETLAADGSVMVLHVFAGNADAIRFYESIGYEFVHEAEEFYGEGLHALVYRKELVSEAS